MTTSLLKRKKMRREVVTEDMIDTTSLFGRLLLSLSNPKVSLDQL